MKPDDQYRHDVEEKLRLFSKRYYLNFSFQNLGLFLIISLLLALILSAAELIFTSASNVRAAILYTYLILEALGLVYLVIIPALKVQGLGKVLSSEEMSQEIGIRESRVGDKLHNVLLLSKMQGGNDNSLIRAAIEQKSRALKDVPFHLTANFKRGLDFLKVAGAVLLFVIITGMTFPDIFNYGTKRIIYYDSDIKPPSPFSLRIVGDETAVRNEPYSLEIIASGELLPKEVYVEIGGRKSLVEKANFNEFHFSIKSVQDDFSFIVTAEGYSSAEKQVRVINRPAIVEMSTIIDYPAYLKRDKASIQNSGNLTIPEGSRISWKIKSEGGEIVELSFANNLYRLSTTGFLAEFDSSFTESIDYFISASHSNGLHSDTANFKIDVVRDRHPSIEVREELDSLSTNDIFYGRFSDDYGISSFRFGYKVKEGPLQFEDLPFSKSKTADDFVYSIDWEKWKLSPGDRMEFFFEVWDNDGINGRKSTRSQKMIYELPDQSEMEEKRDEMKDDIESNLEQALRDVQQLNKEIENLQKEMVQEKKLDWSSKKKIEELIKKNLELKKTLSQIQKENLQKNRLDDKLSPNDEMMEKRKELQELIERVMDDELLEKLKELEKLMEELGKEELNKSMDEMELSNDQLENELERALELFKQLEFEQQLDKAIDDLDKLEKEQEDLKDQTENGDQKPSDLSDEQEELEKKFEEWEKEFEELTEMNEKLEKKQDLKEFEEERKETKESMKEAKESMEKNKKKDAAKEQENATQKMEEMKESLTSMKSDMQAQAEEDIQSLRSTLENLIELSFEQEELMDEMKGLKGDDPRFNDLTRDQRGIYEGLSVVEDSLRALGKRVAQIEPKINTELTMTKINMEKALKNMTSRKMSEFQMNQQLSMTSLNNLALLMDEVVDQLQQQMMQSKGQCSKPGNKKPNSSSMKQLQEQLNKQLEDMKKMMDEKKGQSKGEGKPGSDAESLAKMAAQQAKLREMLRQMEGEEGQEGAKGLQKIGDMMEETEKDIVNREITRETLLRQEKILTKLLESERSERERDMEEKRESTEGENKNNRNLLDLKEYYKSKNSNHEELIKEGIGYNRYFRKKVEEYFKIIN